MAAIRNKQIKPKAKQIIRVEEDEETTESHMYYGFQTQCLLPYELLTRLVRKPRKLRVGS